MPPDKPGNSTVSAAIAGPAMPRNPAWVQKPEASNSYPPAEPLDLTRYRNTHHIQPKLPEFQPAAGNHTKPWRVTLSSRETFVSSGLQLDLTLTRQNIRDIERR